jgi:lysyl-tRNA synthetase class I
MSETVSKYFSDDVLFINLFPIPFCYDWAKLKHTWNIKMHKMKTIIFSMKHTVYIYITLIYNFIVSKNT